MKKGIKKGLTQPAKLVSPSNIQNIYALNYTTNKGVSKDER